MAAIVPPEVSLALLVFSLGLKHGLDPDHLVAIDGLTRSGTSMKTRRWCGLYFSLGHGLVVTAVGVAVALAAAGSRAPSWLEHFGAWISIGVLAALGAANLWAALRSPGAPALVGLRGRWIASRLDAVRHPMLFAAVGAAFAVSFDTISHALLFSTAGGWPFAALLGLLFTAGMALTDALNGWWVARLAGAARSMSFAIAFLCLALAAFGAGRYLAPSFAAAVAPHLAFIGAATFAVLLAVSAATRARMPFRI